MKGHVFIDTSAWVALYARNDQYHQRAKEIHADLTTSGRPYVTTNFVLCETITLLRARYGHPCAVAFGEELREFVGRRWVLVSRISEENEEKAWDLFRRYADKQLSFTDCTSFVTMHELGLKAYFAFDEDFAQTEFAFVSVNDT